MPIQILITEIDNFKKKFCPKCKKSKSVDEFGKQPKSSDGLQGYCISCRIDYNKSWRDNNNLKWNEHRRNHRKQNLGAARKMDRRHREKLKNEFLTAYGNKCACCGEDNSKFLSLDHINNDGAKHREELGVGRSGGSLVILRQMRKEGWPKDKYRILCYNCNIARAQNNGICPHEEEMRLIINANVAQFYSA